jgi:6-phosphogluconolactonase
MGNTIIIFDTAEELAHYFASLLTSLIRKTKPSGTFSWVLSGGNTPKLVFREIAPGLKNSIHWNRVRVFWGDERCVGPEDNDSNYKMARESFLDQVNIPAANIFRIRGEAAPAGEAERYAELFSRNVDHTKGIPRCDLLMLGLGEDGHTASIFPPDIHLFSSDKLFETTLHPETKQRRITATGKIINNAKTVVMLATGESKAARVAQILGHPDGCERLPAARVRPEKGEVIWMLDRQASKKLKSKK